ncbi:MAG: N-acetyl-gamma-glutamyl-phosphate reductase [Desulfobacterales bacterium]|nr:N-acetyl-gamma-glutamyl-phosphate reductase [Desulfobacterales bacterium]
MIKAGVIGATGYAGAELVRILSGHPGVELTTLTSRQYAGVRYDEIYPAMAGVVTMACEAYSEDRMCERADVIFTALPHKLPMALIPGLIERGKKVVDLSADFRFKNVDAYEAHYQPHTAREALQKAVYGLSEVYSREIAEADLVGNPGCYPTSVLLPLAPLLKNRLIDENVLIADSKSGVSGAGRSPSLTTHFCEVNESYKAYKVAEHRHNPEMDEVLSREAGQPVHITFTPHLVPMTRGMLSTIYATPRAGAGIREIRDCLTSFYEGRPFVRICPENRTPDALHVRGVNFCDIGVRMDAACNRLILLSAIDNLVKGAAGQAVQNMNLMFGLPETSGLDQTPFPV